MNLSKFILPCWVEHDPDGNLGVPKLNAGEVLYKVRYRSDQIAAIGITNQRETAIVWERETGKPIYNAIGSGSVVVPPIFANSLKRDGPKIKTSATVTV